MLLRTKLLIALTALLALASLGTGAPGTDEPEAQLARAPSTPPEYASAENGPRQALTSRLYEAHRTHIDHPLTGVIAKMLAGHFGDQPAWRLPLLVQGLNHEPRRARMTAYSSRCPDGGGPRTRWGTPVREGTCAADPRHWGPGSVIWVEAPVNRMLIVEDTGGLVKGRDRFDVSFGSDARAARKFGVRTLTYVPLHIEPPRRNWGRKPAAWEPPAPPLDEVMRCRLDPVGSVIEFRVYMPADRG